MKYALITIMFLVPVVLSAQLNNDGKNTDIQIVQKEKRAKPLPKIPQFSILCSGTTRAPFGFKIEYCKTLGGYASYRADYGLFENNYELTLGAQALLGKYAGIFLGGGLNTGSYYKSYGYEILNWRDRGSILAEAGFMIKFRRFAFEAGAGVPLNNYTHHHVVDVDWSEDLMSSAFIIVGVGYNFRKF